MAHERKKEILLALSKEGDFKDFVERYPGLDEEELRGWIAEAANRIGSDRPSPAAAAEELVIYVDGASRGNPGPAGAGALFLDADGRKVDELSVPLGKTTNNSAEYMALKLSLERAAAMGAKRVSIRSDSELLTRQLNGQYRVRKPHLIPLYRAVRELVKRFNHFEIQHVPRWENSEADRLAKMAVDKATE